MTGEQIKLVQKSFEKVAPISEQAAALFYAKLFDLDPKLKWLFKGDMKAQGQKLMQVLTYAVESLERIEEFIPQVRALGARHAHYGVEDRDYDSVGEALLWTLEKALSREFTARTKEAWAAVYGLLAETMKDASRPPAENAKVV
ncbi:MAG TPA: globin family protein [Pyrinomonadaceae bacterium]|jgi:hemoglobin-like flavoprotein|nr:globin family protein [Pyrinomonadaceae bacterium]